MENKNLEKEFKKDEEIGEKMKRQTLTITPGELYNLARDLMNEELDFRLDIEHNLRKSIEKIPDERLFEITNEVLKQKISINIINKTPECSDTWRIE